MQLIADFSHRTLDVEEPVSKVEDRYIAEIAYPSLVKEYGSKEEDG
jgi:hypothetical protein